MIFTAKNCTILNVLTIVQRHAKQQANVLRSAKVSTGHFQSEYAEPLGAACKQKGCFLAYSKTDCPQTTRCSNCRTNQKLTKIFIRKYLKNLEKIKILLLSVITCVTATKEQEVIQNLLQATVSYVRHVFRRCICCMAWQTAFFAYY